MSASSNGALISTKKGIPKGQTSVCRKKLFKKVELCYSVGETHRTFLFGGGTEKVSTWANGRNIFLQESFSNGWRHIPKEELAANMYSGSEVDLIGKPAAIPLDDHVRGGQLREIIHNEAGKDFL